MGAKYELYRKEGGIQSRNAVVANALFARGGKMSEVAVITNGRMEDKVRVTMDCFDFSGLRKVTKVMTLAGLKRLLAQAKTEMSGSYDRVTHDLEKDGRVQMVMDPKIDLVIEWASRA